MVVVCILCLTSYGLLNMHILLMQTFNFVEKLWLELLSLLFSDIAAFYGGLVIYYMLSYQTYCTNNYRSFLLWYNLTWNKSEKLFRLNKS